MNLDWKYSHWLCKRLVGGPPKNLQYRATDMTVASLFSRKIPKKYLGVVGVGVYIRQEPFVRQNCVFQSRFDVFSDGTIPFPNHLYIPDYCILKFEKFRFLRYFEICQNRSRNSIFGFFLSLLVPLILKHFLMKLARWNFTCSYNVKGGY